MRSLPLVDALRCLLDEWDAGEHDHASFNAEACRVVGLHAKAAPHQACALCFINHFPLVPLHSPCSCSCHKTQETG